MQNGYEISHFTSSVIEDDQGMRQIPKKQLQLQFEIARYKKSLFVQTKTRIKNIYSYILEIQIAYKLITCMRIAFDEIKYEINLFLNFIKKILNFLIISKLEKTKKCFVVTTN